MKSVTEILKSLIVSHGEDIIQQPQRLKAMLADLLPHKKRMRYLLEVSLRAEIPAKLKDIQQDEKEVRETKTNSLKHYFKEEYFLEDNAVKSVFDCWVEVLPSIELKYEIVSTIISNIPTVSIPAGTFIMGSPTTEIDRKEDETQHEVTLSAFRMSCFAITNSDYADFLNAIGIGSNGRQIDGEDPEFFIFPSSGSSDWGLHYTNNRWVPAYSYDYHPVVGVTWYGASAFATYVGGSLPTEAQWEYACRAGTTTPFNTGGYLTSEQANYDWRFPYNGAIENDSYYYGKTKHVEEYEPNAFGLYHMHGNVCEWCSDQYDTYPTTPQTNPTGAPVVDETRLNVVMRGGSWRYKGKFCRSAFRGFGIPENYRHFDIGFRIVFAP